MGERFERRHLEACQTRDGWLLAATSVDGLGYRTYLSGADEQSICDAYSDTLVWHRMVGRGVLAVTSDTKGCVPAETELFNAKRCLLAVRNGESVEAAYDWVFHHQAFGVDGVLIFDQAEPGEGLESLLDRPQAVLVADHSVDLSTGQWGAGTQEHGQDGPAGPRDESAKGLPKQHHITLPVI